MVLGQCVVSFNLECFGLLLKRDLMVFPSNLKLYRTLWLVEVVYVDVCAGLLGEDPAALIFRNTCPRKQSAGFQGFVFLEKQSALWALP